MVSWMMIKKAKRVRNQGGNQKQRPKPSQGNQKQRPKPRNRTQTGSMAKFDLCSSKPKNPKDSHTKMPQIFGMAVLKKPKSCHWYHFPNSKRDGLWNEVFNRTRGLKSSVVQPEEVEHTIFIHFLFGDEIRLAGGRRCYRAKSGSWVSQHFKTMLAFYLFVLGSNEHK